MQWGVRFTDGSAGRLSETETTACPRQTRSATKRRRAIYMSTRRRRKHNQWGHRYLQIHTKPCRNAAPQQERHKKHMTRHQITQNKNENAALLTVPAAEGEVSHVSKGETKRKKVSSKTNSIRFVFRPHLPSHAREHHPLRVRQAQQHALHRETQQANLEGEFLPKLRHHPAHQQPLRKHGAHTKGAEQLTDLCPRQGNTQGKRELNADNTATGIFVVGATIHCYRSPSRSTLSVSRAAVPKVDAKRGSRHG